MTKRKRSDTGLRGRYMTEHEFAEMFRDANITHAELEEARIEIVKRVEDQPRWPGYTENQLSIIKGHWIGTSGGLESLLHFLTMEVTIGEIDPNNMQLVERCLRKDRDIELKQINETINILDRHVSEHEDLLANGEEPGLVERSAVLARRALSAYRDALARELENIVEGAGGFRPSRQNWFQHCFFDRIGRAWQAAGGTVDFGRKYADFWGAVVGPVFADPWVREVHGVALAEGTFKAHVEAFRDRGEGSQSRN